MGTCSRLKGDLVHPCHLAEGLLGLYHQAKGTLHRLHRLKGVDGGEVGEGGQPLVDGWVVLHRTATQWVETVVDPVYLLGQCLIVAREFHLGHGREF